MRKLPEHARRFKGRARNIPERDTFLLPYQAKWVEDSSLLRVMEKSRRVGISYATAYDIVRRHSHRDYIVDTWFSSRDDMTAREFIIYCQKFSKILDKGARSLGTKVLDDKGNTASVLRFSNETRINSVASNPDVFAGKGGNVGLDEFALRNSPRGVWDIANPTIDWGGTLSVISTHRGSANFFNQLIREYREKGNPKGISLHRVTLQDALDQGFLWKLQTKLQEADPRMHMDEAAYFDYQRSRASSEEAFRQEYMCEPADDASAFLPYDMIDACAYGASDNLHAHTATYGEGTIRMLLPQGFSCLESLLQADRGQDLYAGFDVGRRKDLSTLWLNRKSGGVHQARALVEMSKIPFSQQKAIVWAVFALCRRSCIDASGLGMQIAEEAEEQFGRYRIEGITFTRAAKEELAYPVRAAFEDRNVRVPYDDRVTADLRMIRKEDTAGGHVRFVVDENSESDSHADRFWALALSLHAAKEHTGVYIPPRNPQAQGTDQSRTAARRERTVQ